MAYYQALVALILFLNIFAENIAFTVPQNGNQARSNCISQLLNYYSNNNSLISYFEADDIDSIIKTIDTTVIVVDMKKDVRECSSFYKFSMYLVIINDTNEFSIFVARFSHSPYWNPRARFLVIYSGREDIDIIFNMAWKIYIVNINILILNNLRLDLYTYFPYKHGSCDMKFSKELLGECRIYPIENVYPDKIPRTVSGCLSKIAINLFAPYTLINNLETDNSNRVGFENVLIGNLLRRINATVEIIDLNGRQFNKYFPNGTYSGPVSYIHTGQCDLVYGHLWINYAFLMDFDITYPYLFDKNSWFVPAALPGKQWQSLLLIFEKELWLALTLMLICNICIWWFFGRNICEITNWRSFSWCTLYSWSSVLMVSFKLPRNVVLRLLVMSWVITCSFLASAYQTKLLSILTKPVYDKQITTLEELVQSDYNIVYFGAVYDSVTTETDKKVIEKGVYVSFEQHIDMTKNISNTGFMAHSIRIRYNALKYHTNHDGTPKLYEFKKAISFGAIGMYAKKGYPFLDRFNMMITWLWESGLIGKWIRETDQTHGNIKSTTTVRKLKLNHFVGAFYLLLLGLFLALHVFVIELFVVKYCISK